MNYNDENRKKSNYQKKCLEFKKLKIYLKLLHTYETSYGPQGHSAAFSAGSRLALAGRACPFAGPHIGNANTDSGRHPSSVTILPRGHHAPPRRTLRSGSTLDESGMESGWPGPR